MERQGYPVHDDPVPCPKDSRRARAKCESIHTSGKMQQPLSVKDSSNAEYRHNSICMTV